MSAEDYDVFKEREEQRRQRRSKRLANTDDFGWSKHSETHWYRTILGEKLHYWPSANKWLHRGRYYRGGLPQVLKDAVEADNARLRAEAE